MKLSRFIIIVFLQFIYSLDLSGIVYNSNQDKMDNVVIELETKEISTLPVCS